MTVGEKDEIGGEELITCLLVEIKNIDHLKISSWLSFSTFPPTIKSCRMLELEEK